MAGQLPPDVLEDLMLVEAVNAPDGGMPGGLDNVRDDGGENVIEVNFDQREGPLPLEEEEEFDNDQPEDDHEEEEEEISVSKTTFEIP